MERRSLLLLAGGLAAGALTGCAVPMMPTTPWVTLTGPWVGTFTWGNGWGGGMLLDVSRTTATMRWFGVTREYPLDDARRAKVEELARYVQSHRPASADGCHDMPTARARLTDAQGHVFTVAYECGNKATVHEIYQQMVTIAPPPRDVWVGTIERRAGGIRQTATFGRGVQLEDDSGRPRTTVPYDEALQARLHAIVSVERHATQPRPDDGYITTELRSFDAYSSCLVASGTTFDAYSRLLDELFR